ncbi:MAG: biotin--[acetyl-CoA-carboxylase] ligase [Bacteroidales bacterium]
MIIGSKKIYHENLSSTNTHAASLIRKGSVQEGTVIYTGFQTAGRGQMGNRWISQVGKNLLFSVILFPKTIKAERQFIISKAISLGIIDFLSAHTTNLSIKWPNDIYANDDKIAGILIENSLIRDEIDNSIIGIGININQESFPADLVNPVSLKNITGKQYNLEECLNELLSKLDSRYKMILHEKRSQIDREYMAMVYKAGTWAEFRDSNGIFEGRISKVTDTGRLQVEDRRGRTYEYGFKEVDFL